MSDPRDYKLDIGSLRENEAEGLDPPTHRPFLSILFACCGIYQRIYRSPDGTHYAGACPRCGKPVRFLVGARGTSARFFVVE